MRTGKRKSLFWQTSNFSFVAEMAEKTTLLASFWQHKTVVLGVIWVGIKRSVTYAHMNVRILSVQQNVRNICYLRWDTLLIEVGHFYCTHEQISSRQIELWSPNFPKLNCFSGNWFWHIGSTFLAISGIFLAKGRRTALSPLAPSTVYILLNSLYTTF